MTDNDDEDPFSCFGGDSDSSSSDSEADNNRRNNEGANQSKKSELKNVTKSIPINQSYTTSTERAQRLLQSTNARQANATITHLPLESPSYEVFSCADEFGVENQKGLRALRSYKAGDVILREGPAMRVCCSQPASSREEAEAKFEDAVKEAFDALSAETSKAVLGLSSQDKYVTCASGFGIFQTNCFQLGSSSSSDGGTDSDYAGLFLTISRINHSCRPNATHFWRADLHEMMVHATRDIAAGQEICTCYGPSDCKDTAGRRAYLQDRYSFQCACDMCCEGNDSGGDDRMVQLGLLLDDIALNAVAGQDPKKTLRSIDKALELMEEQGISYGETGPFVKPLLHYGYQISLAGLNNVTLARSYLVRELRAVSCSEGHGSYMAIDIQNMLNELVAQE